jgi:16S rRNA (guanine527-N7)-methyltransferase
VDLGAGGGVPGLALAVERPDVSWVLLDADAERVAFLDTAALELGLANVRTVHARAEDFGRDEQARGSYDAVCARSFGRPAVVAECAAPLLRVGGAVLVSDPPDGAGERWPADGLAALGLAVGRHVAGERGHFTVLVQGAPCPERFPRRPGMPERRPLF